MNTSILPRRRRGKSRQSGTSLGASQIQIVVLAAGHGKRMKNNNNLPKVLIPLKGKPLIKHLLTTIAQSGVCEKPLIVIGQKAKEVKEVLGPNYIYVFQKEQLGTGHAIACGRSQIEGEAKDVMVLYGDMPFISAETIKKLTKRHLAQGKVLTMATVKVSNFKSWRQGFYDFGRIIRDKKGKICQIVEKKDANKKQLEIKEVNPSYFCFKADWLWQNLNQLKNNNVQREYYLTDLAAVACQQGQEIATMVIEPKEALGVNTAEHLALVEKLSI